MTLQQGIGAILLLGSTWVGEVSRKKEINLFGSHEGSDELTLPFLHSEKHTFLMKNRINHQVEFTYYIKKK